MRISDWSSVVCSSDLDDAAQIGAVFARRVLPDVAANIFAEVHLAIAILRRQEDAPTVIGHFHVIEVRPAIGLHADSRTQINIEVLQGSGAPFAPPLQVVGLPVFPRALHGDRQSVGWGKSV